jgi:hypothetical protein
MPLMPLMMHTIIRMCKCGETTTLIIDTVSGVSRI